MDQEWQKQTINLNSVIDSNMTDMLRNLSDPAFIFNRQVLQGGYLPTSLRFEKNGWFCGIYGYDFEKNSPEPLTDTEGFMPSMKVERRNTYVSTAYHITADDESSDVDFVYYPLTRVLAYASSTEPTAEWVADENGTLNIVKVQGKTHDFGKAYTFYIDMFNALDGTNGKPAAAKTNDWVTVDPDDIDFDGDGNPDIQTTITFDQKRYVYEYTVYDADATFSDTLTIKYALPFYIGTEKHEVIYDNGVTKYGDDLLTVTVNGSSVTACSDDINITSCSLVTANNQCAAVLGGNIDISVTDNITTTTEKYYIDLSFGTCLCTTSSIGRSCTETVFRGTESCTVPIAGASYYNLNVCNCYTTNVLGDNVAHSAELCYCVPVTVARNFYLIRLFGDDIFYSTQCASNAGMVFTVVPQQDLCFFVPVNGSHWYYCCFACNCAVVGNCIYNDVYSDVYGFYDDLNYDDTGYIRKRLNCTCVGSFNPACICCVNDRYVYRCDETVTIISGGNGDVASGFSQTTVCCRIIPIYKRSFWKTENQDASKKYFVPRGAFSSRGEYTCIYVNADPRCSEYKDIVCVDIPIWESESLQCLTVRAEVILDKVNAYGDYTCFNGIGCVKSMAAETGFSAASDYFCSCLVVQGEEQYALPIPGSVPRFIVHEPWLHHNGVTVKNSCAFMYDVLRNINTPTKVTNSFSNNISLFDALCSFSIGLFNYWCTNNFFANIEVTPITMIYDSYAPAEMSIAVNPECCCLDTISKDNFCYTTPVGWFDFYDYYPYVHFDKCINTTENMFGYGITHSLSAMNLCCTEITAGYGMCKDAYAIEITPELTKGFTYIPSDTKSVPSWVNTAIRGCDTNWSISTDTVKATQLGDVCGLNTQVYLPVEYCYVNRLMTATATTTHDTYHNLSFLNGIDAVTTQVVFTDKNGCTQYGGENWTRDNALSACCIRKQCIQVVHGSAYGCCSNDYYMQFDTAAGVICNAVLCGAGSTLTQIHKPNSNTVGNYSTSAASCAGYTTACACTDLCVASEVNNCVTEPYTTVKMYGKYNFCTYLPLPHVVSGSSCKSACVTNYNKDTYTIKYNGDDTITYNSNQGGITSKFYSASVTCSCASDEHNAGFMCAAVCGADYDYATFTLEGIYKNNGYEVLCLKDISDGNLTLQYGECTTNTCIKTDDIINNKTFLDVTATNIEESVHDADGNDGTNETKIASIELNSDYQLVKQQWDSTIETENMWWLDSDHIMLLTRDYFIIKEKLYDDYDNPVLDDWNGDQWKVVSKISRDKILNTTVTKWGLSNVYGNTAMTDGGALFYTFNILDSKTVQLNIYAPLSNMQKLHTQKLYVKEYDYGHDISGADTKNLFEMYVYMDAATLISQSEITATHVGYHFIIGVHTDNALRQWSFAFRKNGNNFSLETKITGYGYVGATGLLTGGQFPSMHVSAEKGFFGAVHFINDLVDYKNKSVDGDFTMSGIYGTQEQQWYVYKTIPKICSHIQFVETADIITGSTTPFVCKWLPLQSTYSAKYSSPSFLLNRLTGFMPEPTTLGSIFDFGNPSINALISNLTSIASPTLWFLNICWTKFGFLNQAVGQYAYTYRNTDRDIAIDKASMDAVTDARTERQTKEDMRAFEGNASVLTHDMLSFDKQEFEQTCTTKSNSNSGVQNFWLCLLQAGISGINISATNRKPQADAIFNKTEVGDTARAFSQFALENVLNASAEDLGVQRANDVILASKVTAVKTLDMFYSTAANSLMYAGSGYVCHNFIGYCVAQSMSNRFLSGSQSTMFTALTILSNLSFMLKVAILKAVGMLLEKLAESVKGSGAYIMGTGTTWGDVAAAAMRAGKFVTDQLIALNEFFLDAMPQILQAICPNYPNAQFSAPGSMSSHDINIEAKHNYGSKHVTFMYPCFGCESTYFTKETVDAVVKDIPVKIDFTPQNDNIIHSDGIVNLYTSAVENVTDGSNDKFKQTLYDDIHTHYIYAQGSSSVDNVPPDTAVVEGTTTFLPTVPFKNENIDVTMVFPTAPVQDYMIDDSWNIGFTANQGGVLWVSVKDTKVIDGSWSNMVITDDVALIASPYTAIEVKKQIESEYIRPVAVTPNALAWNMTGLNVSYDGKMYHGFDGVGYRLVHWAGTSGMGNEDLTLHYCFQENDHLKRSNILMPNHFFGNFTSVPVIYTDTDARDNVYHQIEIDTKGIGIENLTSAENKNLSRYALPVFTEQLSTMPSVVKTLSSYKLNVIQGVTSLTSDLRLTQNKYKIPKSVDFNINKNLYRATDEYINALNESGLSVGDLTSKLGLEFIGATPMQAFFYSEATKSYYSFTGSSMIQKQDVWNRFKDIKDGKWDFVNQNVVFQCIGNMSRVMDGTDDNDNNLIDNIFIATMNGNQQGITGEITPPNKAVFDNESWFKTYSFGGGLAFQGPNRYIVNRFICLDYMINDIVANKGKWKKVDRNSFNPYRTYEEEFVSVDNRIGDDYAYTEADTFDETAVYYHNIGDDENPVWKRAYGLDAASFEEDEYYTRRLVKSVEGWTHNPFLLATAPLGVSEETDCIFEWELTFTWTDEMDKIYKDNEYACVNIMAQTMCPGGKKRCEPTHLFLHKDLFTRSDNTGYYSFKFASRNGAGNREQLFVWSDAYIAMTGLSVNYKVITERRTMPLATSQIDLKAMKEF